MSCLKLHIIYGLEFVQIKVANSYAIGDLYLDEFQSSNSPNKGHPNIKGFTHAEMAAFVKY